MILQETYTLSNGVKIPKLGLGTWFIPDAQAAEAVRTAVSLGYRHIDTAQAYENEAGVGEGVRTCGLPREQIFVTSKVAAEHKDYDSAARSIDETLEKMGLDYLDMMIIHSPSRGRTSGAATMRRATVRHGGPWRMPTPPESSGPSVCPTSASRIWTTFCRITV